MTQEEYDATLVEDLARRARREKVDRMFGFSATRWNIGDYDEKQAINDVLADYGHPPMFVE